MASITGMGLNAPDGAWRSLTDLRQAVRGHAREVLMHLMVLGAP